MFIKALRSAHESVIFLENLQSSYPIRSLIIRSGKPDRKVHEKSLLTSTSA